MYWNIFDKDRYDLLKKISEGVSIDDYYMIGGTALSLQLGLRESYDFDFCVKSQFNNEILLSELKNIGNRYNDRNIIFFSKIDVLLQYSTNFTMKS